MGIDFIFPPTRTFILTQGNVVSPTPLSLAELSANPEQYESMLVSIGGVSNTLTGDAWPTLGSDADIHITDDGGTTVYSMKIFSRTDIGGSPEPERIMKYYRAVWDALTAD